MVATIRRVTVSYVHTALLSSTAKTEKLTHLEVNMETWCCRHKCHGNSSIPKYPQEPPLSVYLDKMVTTASHISIVYYSSTHLGIWSLTLYYDIAS